MPFWKKGEEFSCFAQSDLVQLLSLVFPVGAKGEGRRRKIGKEWPSRNFVLTAENDTRAGLVFRRRAGPAQLVLSPPPPNGFRTCDVDVNVRQREEARPPVRLPKHELSASSSSLLSSSRVSVWPAGIAVQCWPTRRRSRPLCMLPPPTTTTRPPPTENANANEKARASRSLSSRGRRH